MARPRKPNKGSVDFDFGDRAEIDGIDPGFLADFAKGRLSEYGFESREGVLAVLELACTNGDLRKCGELYFLSGDALDRS